MVTDGAKRVKNSHIRMSVCGMISNESESSGDPDPLSSDESGSIGGGMVELDDGPLALTLSEAAKDGNCCDNVILLTSEVNIPGFEFRGSHYHLGVKPPGRDTW